MMHTLSTIALFGLAAGCAGAQIRSQVEFGPNGLTGSATFESPRSYPASAVIGAPYSAERISGFVQLLADGTRVTQSNQSVKMYRDSQGRTRLERSLFAGLTYQGKPADNVLVLAEVDDPAGRFRLILDPINKVAHRQEFPAPNARSTTLPNPIAARVAAPQPTMPTRPEADAARPRIMDRDLGTQIIDGLVVTGTLRTITLPAGSDGNDQPITTTNEMWISKELNVMVLNRIVDPRHGEDTMKLINFSRAEPDPSLFQVPPDYQLVEEKGEFTIKWGQQ